MTLSKKTLLEAVDRVQESCDAQLVAYIKCFNQLEVQFHLQREHKANHGKERQLLVHGRSPFAQAMSTEITDPSHAAVEQKLPEIKQAVTAETLHELSAKREHQNDQSFILLARIGQLLLNDCPEKVVSRVSRLRLDDAKTFNV